MANKNAKKENKMEQSKEVVKMRENEVNKSQAPAEEIKEDAQNAQENENNSQEVKELGVAGAEMFLKHEAAVKDAKQFYQCDLPAISYYSKRALCDAVDNMKRLNSHSNGTESLEMCIELLEKAIAYLYNRKVNG